MLSADVSQHFDLCFFLLGHRSNFQLCYYFVQTPVFELKGAPFTKQRLSNASSQPYRKQKIRKQSYFCPQFTAVISYFWTTAWPQKLFTSKEVLIYVTVLWTEDLNNVLIKTKPATNTALEILLTRPSAAAILFTIHSAPRAQFTIYLLWE